MIPCTRWASRLLRMKTTMTNQEKGSHTRIADKPKKCENSRDTHKNILEYSNQNAA